MEELSMANVDLKNMSIEDLKNLAVQIQLEIESRKPITELVLYTHDCKDSANYHKNKYKHWSKLIKSVDTSKTNGYAFIGEFLNINYEHKIPVNSIIVEVCDTKIKAYKITASGKELIDESKVTSMSNLIQNVADELICNI